MFLNGYHHIICHPLLRLTIRIDSFKKVKKGVQLNLVCGTYGGKGSSSFTLALRSGELTCFHLHKK